MKPTPHQISRIKRFCQWADREIKNHQLFDPTIQLEQNGEVVMLNAGRYMMRFEDLGFLQVESLVSPWRGKPPMMPFMTRHLMHVLKWSIEDHFALTYQPDEISTLDQIASPGNPEAGGMGSNHTEKKDDPTPGTTVCGGFEAHPASLN